MRPTMRLYMTLPKKIEQENNPIKEAEYFAKGYNRAKGVVDKYKLLYGLMANARKWDVITRTTCYYVIFEKIVGESFPAFWDPAIGWSFLRRIEPIVFPRRVGR